MLLQTALVQCPLPLGLLSLFLCYLNLKLDTVHNFKVTLYGNFAAIVKND